MWYSPVLLALSSPVTLERVVDLRRLGAHLMQGHTLFHKPIRDIWDITALSRVQQLLG